GRWTIKAAIDEGVPVPVLAKPTAFNLAFGAPHCRLGLAAHKSILQQALAVCQRKISVQG
ncbi:MAG: hypothetical protein ABJF23_12280, partial [Bryobacteraceae bacterium]